MRCLITVVALLAAMVLSAPAEAQVAAVPAPVPAAAQTQMQLGRGSRSTILVGSRVRVRGIVGAFVADQTVTIRVFVDGRKVLARSVAIEPHATGTGRFALAYRARHAGRLVVRAIHRPTATLSSLTAVGRSIDVLPRRVGSRSRRSSVRALQRRLRILG